MAQGRCAGCGLTDNSASKMKRHILGCPKYLELWKQDPQRALAPEAEYERWQREDNSEEARAAAKDERLSARFAALDRKREDQSSRWATPPDPLD